MENTPLAPRQRNRRADRQAAQEPLVQQGYTPQPQAPVPAQPVLPTPQQFPVRPMQQPVPPAPPSVCCSREQHIFRVGGHYIEGLGSLNHN